MQGDGPLDGWGAARWPVGPARRSGSHTHAFEAQFTGVKNHSNVAYLWRATKRRYNLGHDVASQPEEPSPKWLPTCLGAQVWRCARKGVDVCASEPLRAQVGYLRRAQMSFDYQLFILL